MAHFLFVDESGQDQTESPCEVLAGVAVRDTTLWPFIQAVQQAELACFGARYSAGARELKAKRLLKTKVFRQAAFETGPMLPEEQRTLARKTLEAGAGASPRDCAALARAKLEFVKQLLDLCARFRCSLFACVVPRGAPRPASPEFLRKDYSYLFERFFYFLEDKKKAARGAGVIVFDELEKSRSHLLIGQMDSYFKHTKTGQDRAKLVIPEPFFVHSDLTTGVQLADVMAYLWVWGHYRAPGSHGPTRPELAELAGTAKALAYNTTRLRDGRRLKIFGITVIRDLRARSERG